MKKHTSENEGRKAWLYALEVLAGGLVLWLLGYVVFAFSVI
jgi:hypothetical protein